MANPLHIEQLKKSVIEWNRWRAENRTTCPDLSDANLRGVDLSGANLSDANLRGVDLINATLIDASLAGTDLRDANLSDANLSGVDLSSTNLSSASLNGANLSNAGPISANLRNADLSDTNLSSADLSGADLKNTNLTNSLLNYTNLNSANLSGADLNQALLYETVFSDVYIKGAKNLDSCLHAGPSTIDHRTLEKSGMLPPIFLRGCGLPDSLIEYYPSFLNQPLSYYSCFISYSHVEKKFARRLFDQLQGRGIRCWLDEHQMFPGDDIFEQVDHGIRYWDKVLLCASEHSLTSWWVENEIKKAFKKEQMLMKQRGKKVLSLIPLNLDGHLFDWENGLADEVRSRLAPDFSGWETNNELFEQSFERVVKALQADNSGRESPPISKL